MTMLSATSAESYYWAPARSLHRIRQWARSRYAVCATTILATLALNTFLGLNSSQIRDCDEARYGVGASEMLVTHSPLITTYDGHTEFWNLKPPLGYWTIGLAYRLIDNKNLAMRIPSALAAMLSLIATMRYARRLGGPCIGLLSGAILATSFGFVYYHGARSGELDSQLTLLMLIFLSLADRMAISREARLGVGLVLSLAFLLKSFAALPFVAAVAIYLVLTRGFGSLRIWQWPVLCLLITVVTYCWARCVAENSFTFIQRMFVEDLLLRSTTEIDVGQTNSILDYVESLLDRMAPWPLFVLLALVASRRFLTTRLSVDSGTLLWCFALVPLALFSLARTHHSWYILPAYPAWAIVTAAGIERLLTWSSASRWAPLLSGALILSLLGNEARLAIQLRRTEMPEAQRFLASLPRIIRGDARNLDVSFVPENSERFILQVLDGYHLSSTEFKSGTRPSNARWLLMRSSPVHPEAFGSTDLELVLSSNAYALYQRNSRLSASDRWIASSRVDDNRDLEH